jgi:hypothetical protein
VLGVKQPLRPEKPKAEEDVRRSLEAFVMENADLEGLESLLTQIQHSVLLENQARLLFFQPRRRGVP